ncbi:beta-lactamase-like protein 3 [Clytia hemisphaerica]|uniref:Beta-lactamase-related domain-containing protein n=1 Tax=Clytia hemisphaerica TaxID=252671 RepID=A0A7M5WQW8_9CNID|eukprot:TCONS_00024768-protein
MLKVLTFLTLIISTKTFDISLNENQKIILREFDDLLNSKVDKTTGLFDGVGSIDVAVWKKDGQTQNVSPVFIRSLGKSQIKPVLENIQHVNISKPSVPLQRLSDEYLDINQMNTDMLPAMNSTERNQYRIASISKSFLGYIADYLAMHRGLDLNEKISPKYIDLSSLGKAHGWDTALPQNGFSSNAINSSVFTNSITFQHLLSHTSGLSRESMKATTYGYGSSRTSTPACPPETPSCSNDRDLNWRPWTKHILQYMMPACGYTKYPESSKTLDTCLPGQYYHYSNAGYSILGLALDSYMKMQIKKTTLEEFFTRHLTEGGLEDTVQSWIFYNAQQRNRTTHGCQGGSDKEHCNQKRALTDYADRGIKTPPGGIWSTTDNLAHLMLQTIQNNSRLFNNLINSPPSQKPSYDAQSEEDPSHMPLTVFRYHHGFYIADNYTCLASQNGRILYGSWGTVPGFTSYIISNKPREVGEDQYAVVMLRSYNYNKRLNLGNQARRLLWRLLNPSHEKKELRCPVTVCDDHCVGDHIQGTTPSSANKLSVFHQTFTCYILAFAIGVGMILKTV